MADIDIHNDPITVNVDTTTVEIKGLDDIHSSITLATPQPLKAETKNELTLKSDNKSDLTIHPIKTDSTVKTDSTIKTDSTAELDVKPLVVDQCLRISFGPVPPTCVRQPYQQHIGFTFFGVEIFGFNVEGEGQVVVDTLPSKPHIVRAEEQPVANQPRQARKHSSSVEAEPEGSVRIRLDH
jgi:hypothetical protein